MKDKYCFGIVRIRASEMAQQESRIRAFTQDAEKTMVSDILEF